MATITDSVAEAVLASNALPNKGQPVFLVAAMVYWGPPVSGRSRTDSFVLWAASPSDIHVRNIRLHYTDGSFGDWIDTPAFTFVKNVSKFSLWKYEFTGRLPTQFVILVETQEGSKFYDNNGGYGVNYRLSPYKGLASNICHFPASGGEGEKIFVLPDITPYKIVDAHRDR